MFSICSPAAAVGDPSEPEDEKSFLSMCSHSDTSVLASVKVGICLLILRPILDTGIVC